MHEKRRNKNEDKTKQIEEIRKRETEADRIDEGEGIM